MPARPISTRIAVSVVYVVAMFMAIMDSTIVNVALPTISRDLSVPLDRVDGVVVGFLVSLAVFIPASGRLGDRLGTRRVFLAALVLFTLASALCGLADSFGELVIATAVMFTGAMAFLGSLYLVALFLQDGLGLSALNAGLSTFPEALGVISAGCHHPAITGHAPGCVPGDAARRHLAATRTAEPR